jgi:hypothetical protein
MDPSWITILPKNITSLEKEEMIWKLNHPYGAETPCLPDNSNPNNKFKNPKKNLDAK